MTGRAAQTLVRPGRDTTVRAGRARHTQTVGHAAPQQKPRPAERGACPCGGGCPRCRPGGRSGSDAAATDALRQESTGRPLDAVTRAFFEPRFGADFGGVRLHTGAGAARAARTISARAFTTGRDVVFADGRYAPATLSGRLLLAHELAHIVQQRRSFGPRGGRSGAAGDAAEREADAAAAAVVRGGSFRVAEAATGIQRQADGPAEASTADPRTTDDRFTGPLTDRDWEMVSLWLSLGEVGVERLTGDSSRNADLIAAAVFCSRALYDIVTSDREDPLLCVIDDVTIADPRVQRLKQNVLARGPIVNWTEVTPANRMSYVMERLVTTHGYPVNAAAGIVGNLYAESGVLPSRVEGSASATPLRAPNFAGRVTTFTPQQVMDRDRATRSGPRSPGVGLAQWTTAARRSGLFQQTQGGQQLGASVLFNMDAQIDYLVSELQARPGLNGRLTAPGVSVNDAADDIVYEFEIPGSILDAAGMKRPRSDPAVQAVFQVRRGNAQRALTAYQAAQQP
jgi:Domain of unknown function (DUF4157)/Phage tail lysozyme